MNVLVVVIVCLWWWMLLFFPARVTLLHIYIEIASLCLCSWLSQYYSEHPINYVRHAIGLNVETPKVSGNLVIQNECRIDSFCNSWVVYTSYLHPAQWKLTFPKVRNELSTDSIQDNLLKNNRMCVGASWEQRLALHGCTRALWRKMSEIGGFILVCSEQSDINLSGSWHFVNCEWEMKWNESVHEWALEIGMCECVATIINCGVCIYPEREGVWRIQNISNLPQPI